MTKSDPWPSANAYSAPREIILIHHTDCGMLTFTDDEFKAQIEADTGLRPGWAPESFRDPAADVKQSLARIAANPFIPHKGHVRGFVYSVTHGSLTESPEGPTWSSQPSTVGVHTARICVAVEDPHTDVERSDS